MTANSMMHSAVDMCRKVLLPLHLVIYEFHEKIFFFVFKIEKDSVCKIITFFSGFFGPVLNYSTGRGTQIVPPLLQ